MSNPSYTLLQHLSLLENNTAIPGNTLYVAAIGPVFLYWLQQCIGPPPSDLALIVAEFRSP